MILEILSKLASESLLSLYPIFVKNIGLPLILQTWSRCFSYAVISAIFIDYPFVWKTLFTKSGLLLAGVTMIHIYTSYRGFEILDSGIAYSIFYLYPIMILLMAGQTIHPVMGLSILGVVLLVSNNKIDIATSQIGIIMVLLAAFTEAIIYFLVRDIKTTNNWNHIFISYFLGSIVLSAYFWDTIVVMKLNGRLSMSLVINCFIGLIGYLLRFFAISRLDTMVYAILSYFGIVMAFVYGVFINNESINLQKIIGASLIIISNILLL